MAKTISKTDAVKTINEIETLEVLYEHIDRNETISSKNTKLNRLINLINKQIKDDRDISIFSVKAK